MSKISGVGGNNYYIRSNNDGKTSIKGNANSSDQSSQVEPIVISEAAIILMEMALRSQVFDQ